jgi:hypothetical protein
MSLKPKEAAYELPATQAQLDQLVARIRYEERCKALAERLEAEGEAEHQYDDEQEEAQRDYNAGYEASKEEYERRIRGLEAHRPAPVVYMSRYRK